MFKRLLFFSFLLCIVFRLDAEEVTGKITSTDDPNGIPGVTILIKGTSKGTTTDLDGNYSINANPSDTLVFSSIGYVKEELEVGNQLQINLTLLPAVEALQEVVVTALGIKREEKALGYSIQKVGGEDVSKVKEIDVVNALSGKVSGVSIMQSDGKVGGGGSRIVIRGENSLAGNNTPLFIINGVRGDANDIAADDIESISVLKGPAAAALYGAEAGAGVIIITSKSGKGVDGISVSFNSNLTFQSPMVLPDYQNKYGMGSGGTYSYYDGSTNDSPYWDDTKYNWGPEFDGENRSQFTGNNPWVAYSDNVKDFYQLGHIFTNNLSVSKSGEQGNFRFSYTNTDQAGVIPNTGLSKNNFSLNSNFNITKGLDLSSNISYIRTNCENEKEVDVRFIPRSIDISALEDYWIPGLEGIQQLNYRQSANNPYFEVYENTQPYLKNKVIANVALNYNPFNGFNVMGRFGTDYINNEYSEKHAYSTYKKEVPDDLNGYYKTGITNTWNRNADFLMSYEKGLLGDFNFKLSFGGSHHRYEYKILEAAAYNMSYADNGLYNLNARDAYLESLTDEEQRYEINSLYEFLNLDYKGKIFLDITNRDDWSSRLSKDNNHFTYPSVSLSALMSELLTLPQQISFWKLRGNVSEVGNDIPKAYYVIEDKTTYSFSSGLTSADPTDTKTDPNLKPEITTGYEAGTDIRFYNNRLGLDAAGYYCITRNQILKTEASSGSSVDYYTQNVGKVESKGLEITLNATPVKKQDFKWNTQVNWSIDRTIVLEFNDDLTQTTRSVNKHLSIVNKVGERVGEFYGKSYVKHDGKQVFTASGDTRTNEDAPLGNYNPDWMGSWNNDLSYKNLTLSFLFDLRYGGLLFNEVERKLNMYGLSEATLMNDRVDIVPDGVVEREDDNGDTYYSALTEEDLTENGKEGGMTGQEYWSTISEESVPENSLVDATYLKFREIRLAYNFPNNWFDKTFIKDVTLSLVGRNLYVWTKVKHIDPETYGVGTDKNDFGGDNKVPGYANASVPTVRSFGFSLNCKF